MTSLAVSLIMLAALAAGWPRTTARRRLRRICGLTRPRRSRRPDVFRWVPAVAALSVTFVVEGWPGVMAGIAAGIVLHRLMRRLESRSARHQRLSAAAALPFGLDLLAASLRAGAPPALASRTVGTALGGPLGGRLCRVADALALGAPPAEAWAHMDGVPGAGRVVLAAVRSSQSGAALAGALTRLADELRITRATACEAAARRAGVLVVLPLGLCFLPAFVLAGLVPIVLSVLGEVIR